MDFTHSDIWRQLFVLPGGQIQWWAEVVRSVLRLVIGVLGALGSVPVLVWGERRLLGLVQGRLGPNRVGPFGLLQPLADAMKLMLKEDITPTNVDKTLYYIAPIVALVPVIMSVTVLPWNASHDWGAVAPGLNIGILFLLAVASIEVYGVILAGWSSNNKYSLLGGLRASSQVISYELGMGLSIIAVLLMVGSLGTHDIVAHQATIREVVIPGSNYTVYEDQTPFVFTFLKWHVFQFFPFGLIATFVYMVSMIAETNRAPFDLPEAETELVAGFHTEYSSFKFAMFFMGEYANMLIVSAICVTLFFGGYLAPISWLNQLPAAVGGGLIPAWGVNFVNNVLISPFWFVSKLATLICFFILVRASYPRLRYDMLMRFGWKFLLPTGLVNVFLIALSMALGAVLQPKFGDVLGVVIGHLIAVAIGIVIAVIVLFGVKAGYDARHRDEAEADAKALVPANMYTDRPAPIRRPTTVTPTPAGAPAPEA